VAGTPGAAFSSELSVSPDDTLISKATHVDREAYSALDGTPLLAALREAGVSRLLIGGLATDYCVRATGLDARAAGLGVVVLLDAVCGVDATPGDADRALAELVAAGCETTTTDSVVAAMESAP
jgi:nicotinamidase/pyrazinamidase